MTIAAHAAMQRLHDFAPEIALVAGSGLDDISTIIEQRGSLPICQLADGHTTTVPGHRGTCTWGMVANRRVLVFRGRFHRYEGHDWQTVCLPVLLARELGVRLLILTNAAGGIREDLQPGSLMLVRGWLDWITAFKPLPEADQPPDPSDTWRRPPLSQHAGSCQIAVQPDRGLIGTRKRGCRPQQPQQSASNLPASLGDCGDDVRQRANRAEPTPLKSVDWSKSHKSLGVPQEQEPPPWAVIHPLPSNVDGDCLRWLVRQRDCRLSEGILAGVLGPNYETPAEIRALRILGADAVGMSTVPELAWACRWGIPVLAISCITNRAAGLAPTRLNHSEVLLQAASMAGRLALLMRQFLQRLS